jgi:hypothetical protein
MFHISQVFDTVLSEDYDDETSLRDFTNKVVLELRNSRPSKSARLDVGVGLQSLGESIKYGIVELSKSMTSRNESVRDEETKEILKEMIE